VISRSTCPPQGFAAIFRERAGAIPLPFLSEGFDRKQQ
jgi:hypothetical protein